MTGDERVALQEPAGVRKPTPNAKFALLANQPIFVALSPDDIGFLSTRARFEHHKKGDTLFHRGDIGNALMVVVSGAVKIWIEDHDGRSVVLNLMRPGQMFGEIAILDGEPRSANATCILPSVLLVVDRRDIQPLLTRLPEMSKQFFTMLCERIRWASMHVENVSLLPSEKRVARTISLLAEQDETGKNRILMTQRELGEMVGLSRESTNKILRGWMTKGWVEVGKGSIIVLKKDKLARVMDDD